MKKFFALQILVILLSTSCKTYLENLLTKTASITENEIKVKLTNLEQLVIPLRLDIKIIDLTNGKEIKIKETLIKIYQMDNKVYLNDRELAYPVLLLSKDDRLISINNKNYPCKIKIVPENGSLTVINILPLERYLLSVVPSEMPLSFDIEALKAQTIIARTYALYHIIRNNNKKEFDVDDTVRFQVYKSFDYNFEVDILKKLKDAITTTEGMIVTDKDSPILAYFHANSGGFIRSGLDYFGKNSDFKYLQKKYDPFSIFYPGSDWKDSIPIPEFVTLLGFTQNTLIEKSNIIYNENGFVKAFKINDQEINVRNIRQKIGYTKIRSERFKIEIDNNNLLFYGIGYGHGVGLSQWGAQGMATAGFNYKEIINFYYPNTAIKKIEF